MKVNNGSLPLEGDVCRKTPEFDAESQESSGTDHGSARSGPAVIKVRDALLTNERLPQRDYTSTTGFQFPLLARSFEGFRAYSML